METLQEVVRALRRAGATAPATTSQHIHVGDGEMTVRQVVNLVKLEYRQEQLLIKSLDTHERCLERYCQPTSQRLVEKLEARMPRTMRELNEAWYGYYNDSPIHGAFHLLDVKHNVPEACPDAPAVVSIQRQMPMLAANGSGSGFAQDTAYDNFLDHGQNQFQQFRKSPALIGRGDCLDDFVQKNLVFRVANQ